jgi:hypothetical protein
VTIKYKPANLLKKIAPTNKIEKLCKGDLTLNKAALSMFNDIDFISKKNMKLSALNAIKKYKDKYDVKRDEGLSITDAKDVALNEKKLLVDRVQNAVLHEVSEKIGDKYAGEFYEWLPSTAIEPDEKHMLNYGKVFQIGKGEMPGERWGCQCGMEILVPEKKLEL